MLWLLLPPMFGEITPSVVEAPEEPNEEVFVWSKPFERFDDRWWSVKYEIIAPVAVDLGDGRMQLPARAWQLEALLHCEIVEGGKRAKEVGCTIEQAALRAHLPGAGRQADTVLTDVAASLSGMVMQLEATRKGRIPSVDLEGTSRRSSDHGRRAEARRVLVLPIASALNQELHGHQPGDRWTSKHEPLLTIATHAAGLASARVKWQMDRVEEHWVAQANGHASVMLPASNVLAGMPCATASIEQRQAEAGIVVPSEKRQPKAASMGGGEKPAEPEQPSHSAGQEAERNGEPLLVKQSACTPGEGQGAHREIHQNYRLDLSSVSVIDPRRGYAVERVWSVSGRPSADLKGTKVWSSGLLVAFDQHPEVAFGASGRIGAPGRTETTLPTWEAVVQLPEGTP